VKRAEVKGAAAAAVGASAMAMAAWMKNRRFTATSLATKFERRLTFV
jgi:hypothetical protein